MLIPRTPTCTLFSDAAHTGLGGWSADLKFVWRLTKADMEMAGFPMKQVDENGVEHGRWCKRENLPEGHEELLHINPLEFIAIIINVWFATVLMCGEPPREGGHHITVRADNTSALSWLRYAARSHRRPIRNLAYFLHGFILVSQTSETTNFTGAHIPGTDNVVADAVSRPEKFHSMGSVIDEFCQLATCQPYQVPFGLLSTLARWISCDKIAVRFELEMTNLLKLVPRPFPPGARDRASTPGFYGRVRRKRCSASLGTTSAK